MRRCQNCLSGTGQGGLLSQVERAGKCEIQKIVLFCEIMKAGDVIGKRCVRIVRSGFGVAPKHFEAFLRKQLRLDTVANRPLTSNILEGL